MAVILGDKLPSYPTVKNLVVRFKTLKTNVPGDQPK
jgi:hypothetical protein